MFLMSRAPPPCHRGCHNSPYSCGPDHMGALQSWSHGHMTGHILLVGTAPICCSSGGHCESSTQVPLFKPGLKRDLLCNAAALLFGTCRCYEARGLLSHTPFAGAGYWAPLLSTECWGRTGSQLQHFTAQLMMSCHLLCRLGGRRVPAASLPQHSAPKQPSLTATQLPQGFFMSSQTKTQPHVMAVHLYTQPCSTYRPCFSYPSTTQYFPSIAVTM